MWGGNHYENYKKYIFSSIKKHYNIDVECSLVKEFGNYSIYKVQEKEKIEKIELQ